MITAISILLCVLTPLSFADDRPEFVPDFPFKPVRFNANHTYSDPSTCKNSSVWLDLQPPGDGLVLVPDAQKYSLLPGLPSKCGTELYGIAMFHQLHCLSRIRETYHELRQTNVPKVHHHGLLQDDHLEHCFDYLRQSIQCSADMTLEHSVINKAGELDIDGWTVEHRQCRDYDAILNWTDKNRCTTQPPLPRNCVYDSQ